MKLLLIAVVALVPCVLAGTDSTDKRIMEKVDLWNLYSNCWGETNMIGYCRAYMSAVKECTATQAPIPALVPARTSAAHVSPASSVQLGANPWQYGSPYLTLLGRKKRQAPGILSVTAEDKANLIETFHQFQAVGQEKMNTMHCVLQKFGIVDAYRNIDINSLLLQYSQGEKTHAAADPEFMGQLTTKIRDCYDISQSWPQLMLDRNAWTQKYGRQYIFIQCMKKMEEKMCYMYTTKRMMDAMFGNMDHADHSAYGLPADKYEAAYAVVKAATELASPAEKFVDEILFSKSNFL